eukprot:2041720-Alexandrium_andersonii.AAC.1
MASRKISCPRTSSDDGSSCMSQIFRVLEGKRSKRTWQEWGIGSKVATTPTRTFSEQARGA